MNPRRATPRVRVVVLDYDGGDLTIGCLEHLVATEHPPDALDIVLVDNASRHSVADQVRRDLPTVSIIESAVNLGFAGGCNLGMGALDDVDYVALVNNDAMVPPDWLAPLLDTLEAQPELGAASPKILLARTYRAVDLRCTTERAGYGDSRELGVRVSGVRVHGKDAWRDARFAGGTWGPEIDRGGGEYQWTAAAARVLVPVTDEPRQDDDDSVELRLDAPRTVTVTARSGDRCTTIDVGPEPVWRPVPAVGAPFDVVNNVGTHLVADGYAADRGWLERDEGQYERAEDVFAWCGAAVLLRADYLRDIGRFDERLFLYSEDFELSWRGLRHGWRHRYVPGSVVRHVHSASSARAASATILKERNRLLVLIRHGSPGLLARALLRYGLVTLSYARRDLVAPLRAGEPARPAQVRSRIRALAGVIGLAPAMLSSRRSDRASLARRIPFAASVPGAAADRTRKLESRGTGGLGRRPEDGRSRMRPPGRRTVALVAGLALVASALVVLAPVAPERHAAGAAVATNSDPDYATVELSDPWDYSNAADFPVDGAIGVTSHRLANGVLDAHVNAGGGLVVAQAIAGAIPLGRSTTLHPIDANNLRKVAFRLWADRSAAGGFFWYTCDHIIPSCENGFSFTVQAGWNDYAFDIPTRATLRAAPAPRWQGVIKGLRFVPAGSGPAIHIQLDYLRLVPLAGSSAPPTPPVPLPVVDSPGAAGGVDFATVVRHDPWDLSQPSDIFGPENMSYGFTGSWLNGINIGANRGDAHFSLPLAGPIDGTRFHRLTFDIFYEGPFSLGFGPGGGMVARLIWQTAAAPGAWQDSDDIVVFPGWSQVTVDLATTPPWAITDPNTARRIGWAGQQITQLRFDPHEDSGGRRFLIDNIKIAEDATGYGGTYDIGFHDDAWQPGTTADISTSPTRGAAGGTRIASDIPVAPGRNTFHWAPSPLVPETVWVNVVLKRGSYRASAYADGPLRMTASPSPLYGVNPFGSFDRVSAGPTGVRAQGWAIDPDSGGPIAVHLWVDGRPVAAVTADGSRPDVQAHVPGFGADHGFDATVPLAPGSHSVCAYGINTGAGVNRLLGCRPVSVRSDPFGTLDAVTADVGFATVRGWAVDPNSLAPIAVHVWVDGRPLHALTADADRPDVARAVPGFGSAHGYGANLSLPSGPHRVCTYGINTGPGTNVLLGCRSVVLPSNPLGALDVVHSDRDGITVRGWAIDPDTNGPITVHLSVQGGGVSAVRADQPRADLGARFPVSGPAHGFVATRPGSTSPHRVCAYGVNVGAGSNTLLGCRTG